MTSDPGPLPRRGGLLTAVFLVAVGIAVIAGAIISTRDDDEGTTAAAVQAAIDETTATTEEAFHAPGGPLAGTVAADFEIE